MTKLEGNPNDEIRTPSRSGHRRSGWNNNAIFMAFLFLGWFGLGWALDGKRIPPPPPGPPVVSEAVLRAMARGRVVGPVMMAPPMGIPPAPVDGLQIYLTNLSNVACIDLSGPFLPGVISSPGGTAQISVACLSGPGYALRTGSTNAFYVEVSSNLVQWAPFPSAGAQLMLSATNGAWVNLVSGSGRQWFRGHH